MDYVDTLTEAVLGTDYPHWLYTVQYLVFPSVLSSPCSPATD